MGSDYVTFPARKEICGTVAELVDARDLKSRVRKSVPVRFRPVPFLL